jgi:hypothetical protein
MAKGFDSSAPEAPRNGQNVAVLGFTDNENQGVSIVLVPCPECSAAVEDAHLPDHESWHAAQGGAEPKMKK